MLSVSQLHYNYRGRSSLFQGVDFGLEPSTICGLLGKNGAGKTTLLRLLTGALFPKEGTIQFQDQEMKNRMVSSLQDMYFLQEDFELPKYSVQRYLETYSVFYPNFNKEIFYDVLSKFEVNSNEKLKNYSFGQKKKFHVAFALATQVKLLILDEPTNGMDIPSKAIFRSVVSSSLGEHQSIIISTHQIRDLGQLLDSILLIENGRIILNDSLYNLSEKLNCQYVPGNQVPEESYYHEPVPGGNMCLLPTSSHSPGEIDIEVLFNGVISNPQILSNL